MENLRQAFESRPAFPHRVTPRHLYLVSGVRLYHGPSIQAAASTAWAADSTAAAASSLRGLPEGKQDEAKTEWYVSGYMQGSQSPESSGCDCRKTLTNTDVQGGLGGD